MTEDRLVLRCPECKLNQFLTKSGKCRRCHVLIPREVPMALVVAALSDEPEPITDVHEWFSRLMCDWLLGLGLSPSEFAGHAKGRPNRSMLSGWISKGRVGMPSLGYVERLAMLCEVDLCTFLRGPGKDVFAIQCLRYYRTLPDTHRPLVRKLIADMARSAPDKEEAQWAKNQMRDTVSRLAAVMTNSVHPSPCIA